MGAVKLQTVEEVYFRDTLKARHLYVDYLTTIILLIAIL